MTAPACTEPDFACDPRRMANAIRILALDAIAEAGDGHPGAPLGCAEMPTALFAHHLNFAPHDPRWFDRDRFVLSNGHGSMLLYAVLHLTDDARPAIRLAAMMGVPVKFVFSHDSIGTGSEVAIALAAGATLQAQDIPTAVVSLPGWELFARQPAAYRAAVIGPGTVRVAVEAAIRRGWERWIGEDGGFVGMTGFGASGPEDELFAHFGITAGRVVAEAPSRLSGHPRAARRGLMPSLCEAPRFPMEALCGPGVSGCQ